MARDAVVLVLLVVRPSDEAYRAVALFVYGKNPLSLVSSVRLTFFSVANPRGAGYFQGGCDSPGKNFEEKAE